MKRNLLLGFALFAGFAAQAVTSPYTGSEAAEGTYYLYQVETNQWLQPNMRDMGQWTTYGTLGSVGIDVQLLKPEGKNFEGWQINVNFTGNGELNGSDQDRFFFDQNDRALCDWIFEPVELEGGGHAYKIMIKANDPDSRDRDKIANDTYIGAKDGLLSDNPEDFTWQLVSKKEREEKMIAASANGPQDASWLIPWYDGGRNDKRDRQWTHEVNNNQGGNWGNGGSNGYPVFEYWHYITMTRTITLTDLPNGTYKFSVQAYYRDGEIDNACARRYVDNAYVPRAFYYAGAQKKAVMSIWDDAQDQATDGFSWTTDLDGTWTDHKYVPNSTSEAATAMFNGHYINEYLTVPVNDGQLAIGIDKPEGEFRDWLITKRMYLQYVGQETQPEDLSGLQKELSDLITLGESLPEVPSLTAAIEEAKASLGTSSSSTALLSTINKMKKITRAVSSAKDVIATYNATKKYVKGSIASAEERLNKADSKGGFEDALKELRYLRRREAREIHENVFKGNVPAAGEFYLYNVGQKQFLCGGSDWGAHAALGMPGLLLTLEDANPDMLDFHIETGLYNGDDKHYLNYRGYMDCPKAGAWRFVPVEGKENVYNIAQTDYPDAFWIWDPYTSVDDGHSDETTVCTERRGVDLSDENAQWMLVTKADRDALMEKASLENPVDVSYYIQSPNFSQREDVSGWTGNDFAVWERGANHYDFCGESWNTGKFDISQMIQGLPAGIYATSAQGFYRNGRHNTIVENENTIYGQADLEPLQNAYLSGNLEEDDVPFPSITAESGNAPSEGTKTTSEDGTVTYEIPYDCVQASNYFKSGLYKTYAVSELGDGDEYYIGASKSEQANPQDWVVFDNFRIVYYGKDTTKEAVKEAILAGIDDIVTDENIDGQRPADNRIYNLLGIPVENPTAPGIYIQNGQKFIVK